MVTPTEAPAQTEEMDLLANLLANAEAAAEPKNPLEADVLRQAAVGGDSVPMGTVVTSAGHIVVYSTKTGEASLLNRNMLPWINPANQYAWRFEDGTISFTTVKPTKVEPIVGTILCVLHVDHPERAHYDAIGLKGRTCRKSNLMTLLDQESHAAGKHRAEWRVIVRDKEQREREEDRAVQHKILELAARGVPAAAPVPTVPSKPQQTVACTVSDCPQTFEGGTVMVAQNKMKRHVKKEHPDG